MNAFKGSFFYGKSEFPIAKAKLDELPPFKGTLTDDFKEAFALWSKRYTNHELVISKVQGSGKNGFVQIMGGGFGILFGDETAYNKI